MTPTEKALNREFVPYEQALELEMLGFDELCMSGYDLEDNTLYIGYVSDAGIQYNPEYYTPAPLYSQAFRWFREKHNLRGFIGFRPNTKQFDCHVYDMSLSGREYAEQRTMQEYNRDPLVGSYEEAELECLNKLIEIVKNK
jgi:hypothetical protein